MQQRLSVQYASSQDPLEHPLRNSEQALDEAIKTLEKSSKIDTQHRRMSSFSSVENSPEEASYSTGHRSSLSSHTSWSDSPPEYDDLPRKLNIDDKRDSVCMNGDGKMLLNGEKGDSGADLAQSRSLSTYSNVRDADEFTVQAPSAGSKTLHVHARGMHSIRLPLPSKELEIQIANPDGTVAYISSRTKRSSPDSSLSKPGFGEYVRTSYNKKTTLTCRRAEGVTTPFTMTGSNLRRQRAFRLPSSDDEFEWRYANANASVNGRQEERLVLVHKSSQPSTSTDYSKNEAELDQVKSAGTLSKRLKAKGPKMEPRVLAQFSRSDLSLQAYGSNSKRQATRAGVGGELVLEPDCTDLVPEEVVVATALVMIKREQDRLRIMQTAVIVAVLL